MGIRVFCGARSSCNFALQLQTRSLKELRKKFHELNVMLKQIVLEDEKFYDRLRKKFFVDERIVIGERLLQNT